MRFVECQTQMSLALAEPEQLALQSDSNTTSENAPQVESMIIYVFVIL